MLGGDESKSMKWSEYLEKFENEGLESNRDYLEHRCITANGGAVSTELGSWQKISLFSHH